MVYVYQGSFIHSSVSGHLACFHDLAVVNNAAVSIGVHVSFLVMVPSGYMLTSGILGSYRSFIPSFLKGISVLFSIVAVSIYIPTSSARGYPLLHTLSTIYCL